MGLTARQVAQLAKRRPEVIENIGEGHVRRVVDFFLQDLGVEKVGWTSARACALARIGLAAQVDAINENASALVWVRECVMSRGWAPRLPGFWMFCCVSVPPSLPIRAVWAGRQEGGREEL